MKRMFVFECRFGIHMYFMHCVFIAIVTHLCRFRCYYVSINYKLNVLAAKSGHRDTIHS